MPTPAETTPEVAAVVTPVVAAVTAPVVTTPAVDPVIHVTSAEYRRFLAVEAENATLKAAETEKVAAAEQTRLVALAESGQAKQALETATTSHKTEIANREQRIAQLENERLDDKLETVLAAALGGKEFVTPFAREDAVLRLKAGLVAVRDAETGAITVVDRATRRPAAGWIDEQYASDRFAHMRPAKSKGGAGGGGLTPAPNETEIDPNLNPEQASFAEYRNRSSSMPSGFAPVGRRGAAPSRN